MFYLHTRRSCLIVSSSPLFYFAEFLQYGPEIWVAILNYLQYTLLTYSSFQWRQQEGLAATFLRSSALGLLLYTIHYAIILVRNLAWNTESIHFRCNSACFNMSLLWRKHPIVSNGSMRMCKHTIYIFFMVKTLICVVGLEASHVHVTFKSSMQLLQQLYIACMQELEFNNKFTSRFLLVYSYWGIADLHMVESSNDTIKTSILRYFCWHLHLHHHGHGPLDLAVEQEAGIRRHYKRYWWNLSPLGKDSVSVKVRWRQEVL